MRIRTLEFVNARTRDGRTYSAGENTVTVVDDADPDMVEMMHRLAAGGLIEIQDEPTPAAAKVDDETKPATTKSTKTTSTGKAG